MVKATSALGLAVAAILILPASAQQKIPADSVAFTVRSGGNDPIASTAYPPQLIQYRRQMLLFIDTPVAHLTNFYVARATTKKLLDTKYIGVLPDGNHARQVRPVVFRGELYACVFKDRSIVLLKAKPFQDSPDDLTKLTWINQARTEFHQYTYGADAAPLVTSSKEGAQASLFLFRATEKGLRISTYNPRTKRFTTEKVFDADTLYRSVSVVPIQVADGTPRLAVAAVAQVGARRSLRLWTFNGRSLFRADAVDQLNNVLQDDLAPWGVYLLPGTVQGGTRKKNLVQLVAETRGTAIESVPVVTLNLYRAEYEIAGRNGAGGKFLDRDGSSLARLRSKRSNPASLFSRAQAYHFPQDLRLSTFTFASPKGFSDPHTDTSNVGVQTHIGLLGTDSSGRVNALFADSNILVPYGFTTDSTGVEWQEKRGARSNTAALDDEGDFRNWIFLGAIYGPPPYALNGASSGRGLSEVTISKSNSKENRISWDHSGSAGFVSRSEAFNPLAPGPLFFFSWDTEILYAGGRAAASEETTSVTVRETLVSEASDEASTGYLLFLTPTIYSQTFKMADWSGDLIPRKGRDFFTYLYSEVAHWSVRTKTFDMTGKNLPPYAKGILTKSDFVSTRPEGWRDASFSTHTNSYFSVADVNSLVMRENSRSNGADITTTATSTETITHGVDFNIEALFFGIAGFKGGYSMRNESTVSTSNSYTLSLETSYRDPQGEPGHGEALYATYTVKPYFLNATSGSAFFIPNAYRTQKGIKPFCIFYTTSGISRITAENRASGHAFGYDSPALLAAPAASAYPVTRTAARSTAHSRNIRLSSRHFTQRVHRATSRSNIILTGRTPNDESPLFVRKGSRLMPTVRKGSQWFRQVPLRNGANIFRIETRDESGAVTPLGRVIVIRSK